MPPKAKAKAAKKAEEVKKRQSRSSDASVKVADKVPDKSSDKKSSAKGKKQKQQKKSKSPSPPPKNKRKSKKSPSPTPVVKDEPKKKVKEEKTEETPQMVKLIKKGAAPVDQYCSIKDKLHVFQEGSTVYSATLNQSNLDHNNNKFYIIQVLQDDTNSSTFYCFNRWGRVGVPGQQALKGPYSQGQAISDYQKKLREKTISGDYIQLHIKYDEEEETKTETKPAKGKSKKSKKDIDENEVKEPVKQSTLPTEVKNLINLIFDMKMINTAMKEIGYDAKKCPLGQLGDVTIKEAYQVLNNLMEAIKNKKTSEYSSLSSQFYSLIPHDFGFQKMINFILNDEEKVKQKLSMLQNLTDMKIATKMIETKSDSKEDLVDQNYEKLKCELKPLKQTDEEYKIIEKYIENTKQNYSFKILDVFGMNREGEDKRFDKKIGNEKLLWHGSRVSNFVGIISQGLRIAPPEAPASGYLYGKGIYFADLFSKSACYCRSDTSNGEILIMLVDVACGNQNVLEQTDFNAQNLPPGKDSTFAWGTLAPDENQSVKINSKVEVPLGKPQRTKSKHYMTHNEYIVYSLTQAKLRYLIRGKLN